MNANNLSGVPKPNPKPPQTHRPRSGSSAAVNGEPPAQGEEQDTKCAVCDDGDCENTNAIVFCDGCDLAVHQECYGVPYIPEGQWLCRKCQQVGKALPTCIFCPNTDGAFKLTTESKWAHLVCSIWITEVSIANPSFMEPITSVAEVPKSRWKLVSLNGVATRRLSPADVLLVLLHLQPENGRLHPMRTEELLSGIPCDVCAKGQAVFEDEDITRWQCGVSRV